jgi:fatty acid amide hydrolase
VERRRPAGLDNVRIAVWDQADYFAPSPAIRRAVTEAALVLREAGSTIVSVPPPPLGELVDLFLGIGTADGGEMFRQLLRGSDIDPRVASILHSAQMPAALRALRVSWLVRSGQRFSAEMLRATGRRSVAEYWRLCRRLGDLRQACFSAWDKAGLDAAILPAYGLPAIPHGDSVNLLCAAGYALAANALGLPAGSVAVTCVPTNVRCGGRIRIGSFSWRPARNSARPDCRSVSRSSLAPGAKARCWPS